jgi:5'-deoxynucleotidase YfbR-like HD superfamily hydrolase
MKPMLETVTGRFVDVENPDASMIDITDIAWGLSRMPRFCGHTITAQPYTVAQHSVFVAKQVEEWYKNNNDGTIMSNLPLYALLHDAAEIYTGDLPSPIKRIPALRVIIKEIEGKLMDAIYAKFNLLPLCEGEEAWIKKADKIAQKIEAHAFMPSRGKDWPDMPEVSLIQLQTFDAPMASLDAYKAFMDYFDYCTEELIPYYTSSK